MCKDWSATERCSSLGVWTLASGLEWTGKCSVFEECPTECILGVCCVCIENWSNELPETSSAEEVSWLQRSDFADLLLVAVPQIQSLSYFQISTFHSRQEWDASQLPLTSVPHPLPYTHQPPPSYPLLPPPLHPKPTILPPTLPTNLNIKNTILTQPTHSAPSSPHWCRELTVPRTTAVPNLASEFSLGLKTSVTWQSHHVLQNLATQISLGSKTWQSLVKHMCQIKVNVTNLSP